MINKSLVMLVVLVAGLGLSACGTTTTAAKFSASRDCRVTATNYDLAGCNLSGENLSHDDLQSDDLQRADLSGANLDYANLQGANLKGADLKGVRTNDLTICVNAEVGPCTKPGLNSASSADASQNE
ncbi:MAG: pentapeptide repeat-containing protein [Acidimicrobiales bacterium]